MGIVDYIEIVWGVSFSVVIILHLYRLDSQAKLGTVFPGVRSTPEGSTFRRQEQRAVARLAEACPMVLHHGSPLSLSLGVDAASVGLLRGALFPSLYLAKTAVPWAASVLRLEQRKYCHTCQNWILFLKAAFYRTEDLWPPLFTADRHVEISIG